MTRLPDWRERLNALRNEKAREPFSWGHWDCCCWAGAAVEATTGTDPRKPFARHYRSERGAVRLLHKHGGLVALLTSLLGATVHPAFGADGDIVLTGNGVAVARGDGTADAVGDAGFIRVARADWLKVWKV